MFDHIQNLQVKKIKHQIVEKLTIYYFYKEFCISYKGVDGANSLVYLVSDSSLQIPRILNTGTSFMYLSHPE